jgi:hypothetical protein
MIRLGRLVRGPTRRPRKSTDINQLSVRLDQVVSSKSALFARFSYNQVSGPTTNPDQTTIDPSFGVNFFDHQRSAAVRYWHTMTPHLSFTVGIAYIRSTPFFPATNHTDPALVYGDGLYQGFNTADGSIIGSYGNLYQGRWDATYIYGSHSFQWGYKGEPRYHNFRYQSQWRLHLRRRNGLFPGSQAASAPWDATRFAAQLIASLTLR